MTETCTSAGSTGPLDGVVTLVDGSTFCISGRTGDLFPEAAQGLFYRDTRILSTWQVRVQGTVPHVVMVLRAEPSQATFISRVPVGDQQTELLIERTRYLADGMNVFAVLYGVPVWGFAVLWIGLATALTVRTVRRGMPFALTWWSLTFPVGTFVTGTTQLALHTGLPAFRVAAAIAYVALLGTWCLVALRTFRGGLGGGLFAAPAPGPVRASKDPAR